MADLLGLRTGGAIDNKATAGVSAASETTAGIAELATQAETDAGTDDLRIVTPLKLKATLAGRISPSPFINGALQFWQRGTSFAAIASGAYSADRFIYVAVGAMVHTASQSADVPTVAQAAALLPYSLLLDCTTVDSSIAASDFCIIQHLIEGNFASSILQRQFTLSFWVKGTKTGIHCVSFRNQVSDRSYVAEYTINTTATWEYKTITVSASPTAGTWNYTTGMGLSITWALVCGSTYQTTAGTWQTGNFIATSGQVNACDSTSNDFRITGIRVDPGAAAVAFVLPDHEQELERCQRYYQKSYAIGTNPGTATSFVNCSTAEAYSTSACVCNNAVFSPRLRATPTVLLYSDLGTVNKISNTGGADIGTTVTASFMGDSRIPFISDSGAGLTATGKYFFHWTAIAEI